MYIDVWTMLTHFIADAAKAAGMKSMKRRRKMIEVGYLVDSKGAQKFGTCASCGKGSDDDPKMVRVTYSHHDSISRTSNCLCADCRRLLLKTIRDGIKDEPTIELAAERETTTVTIGKTRGGRTEWYECDNCGAPVHPEDRYCSECGRRLKFPQGTCTRTLVNREK